MPRAMAAWSAPWGSSLCGQGPAMSSLAPPISLSTSGQHVLLSREQTPCSNFVAHETRSESGGHQLQPWASPKVNDTARMAPVCGQLQLLPCEHNWLTLTGKASIGVKPGRLLLQDCQSQCAAAGTDEAWYPAWQWLASEGTTCQTAAPSVVYMQPGSGHEHAAVQCLNRHVGSMACPLQDVLP